MTAKLEPIAGLHERRKKLKTENYLNIQTSFWCDSHAPPFLSSFADDEVPDRRFCWHYIKERRGKNNKNIRTTPCIAPLAKISIWLFNFQFEILYLLAHINTNYLNRLIEYDCLLVSVHGGFFWENWNSSFATADLFFNQNAIWCSLNHWECVFVFFHSISLQKSWQAPCRSRKRSEKIGKSSNHPKVSHILPIDNSREINGTTSTGKSFEWEKEICISLNFAVCIMNKWFRELFLASTWITFSEIKCR